MPDVHAHDVEFAPSTAHGAVNRRDRSTDHNSTVRTIVQLQRLAGNESVNALLDEHASSPFEQADERAAKCVMSEPPSALVDREPALISSDLILRLQKAVGNRAVVDTAGSTAVQRRSCSGGCSCGGACGGKVTVGDEDSESVPQLGVQQNPDDPDELKKERFTTTAAGIAQSSG